MDSKNILLFVVSTYLSRLSLVPNKYLTNVYAIFLVLLDEFQQF